jgi:hypothetical protein
VVTGGNIYTYIYVNVYFKFPFNGKNLCMINTQNWVRIVYYIYEFCRCHISLPRKAHPRSGYRRYIYMYIYINIYIYTYIYICMFLCIYKGTYIEYMHTLLTYVYVNTCIHINVYKHFIHGIISLYIYIYICILIGVRILFRWSTSTRCQISFQW